MFLDKFTLELLSVDAGLHLVAEMQSICKAIGWLESRYVENTRPTTTTGFLGHLGGTKTKSLGVSLPGC